MRSGFLSGPSDQWDRAGGRELVENRAELWIEGHPRKLPPVRPFRSFVAAQLGPAFAAVASFGTTLVIAQSRLSGEGNASETEEVKLSGT